MTNFWKGTTKKEVDMLVDLNKRAKPQGRTDEEWPDELFSSELGLEDVETEAQYQILRAIVQLRDNPKSLDSVVAQLTAYLSQETNEKQTRNEQLAQELATIQIELKHLGRMLCQESVGVLTRNHQIAIYQHVERIRKEL